MHTSGKLDVNSLGSHPVEGGHEDNGSPLYIARAKTKRGNIYPGKASSVLKGAYVTEGDDEVGVNVSFGDPLWRGSILTHSIQQDYEVLCYV